MKRSDSTVAPPGISIRTGPWISSGSLGVARTSRTVSSVTIDPPGSRLVLPRGSRSASCQWPPAILPAMSARGQTEYPAAQRHQQQDRLKRVSPVTALHP